MNITSTWNKLLEIVRQKHFLKKSSIFTESAHRASSISKSRCLWLVCLSVCLCHRGNPASWWTGEFWSLILAIFLRFEEENNCICGLLQSLVCIMGEIAGEGSAEVAVAVGVGDGWQVTCNMWHIFLFSFFSPFLSVLILVPEYAHVKRFSVSCMWDFCFR